MISRQVTKMMKRPFCRSTTIDRQNELFNRLKKLSYDDMKSKLSEEIQERIAENRSKGSIDNVEICRRYGWEWIEFLRAKKKDEGR